MPRIKKTKEPEPVVVARFKKKSKRMTRTEYVIAVLFVIQIGMLIYELYTSSCFA